MSSKRAKQLKKSIREAGKIRRGEAVDRLAEQALKEHRAGRTRKMGLDELQSGESRFCFIGVR